MVRSYGAPKRGAIMAVTNARYTAEHDQPAIEVAIEVEGEIRELVRRNVVTKPGRQPENQCELVASNINSVLQQVTATSVQEIDQLAPMPKRTAAGAKSRPPFAERAGGRP